MGTTEGWMDCCLAAAMAVAEIYLVMQVGTIAVEVFFVVLKAAHPNTRCLL